MVRPPLTSREENSMFVDTLPSPYYDMLVVNAFIEFRDLMYFVGRIEDGIKKVKSWTLRQPRLERKGMSPISMLKNEAEENSRQWENLSGTSFTHVLHVPRCPQSDIFRPKCLHGKIGKGLTQAITRARKGKGLKCTIHFQCLIQSCSPY